MKTLTIIQARKGSTRLPGKVLKDIAGRTMLERVVERVRAASKTGRVMVATTISGADDELAGLCKRIGIDVFRGSEEDVLDRYYRAALEFGGDTVVRVTSDCPLVDPGVLDEVIGAYESGGCDYASNFVTRTFPRGLDAECFSFDALITAWSEAEDPAQRQHVTPFIRSNGERFALRGVTFEEDLSRHRWTVDTAEDLAFVREVYDRLGEKPFTWRDVLALVEAEPALAAINANVQQKGEGEV